MKQFFTLVRTHLFHWHLPTLSILLWLPQLSWGQPTRISTTRLTAATYTWSATGTSASWSAADSWTPTRTTPAASDVLQFTSTTGAATAVLDFSSSQTIGRLVVQNGCTITFSTATERTLTVSDGSTGADFVVESGAQLTLYHDNSASLSDYNPGLALKLGTGATASVGGRLALNAYKGNVSSSPTQNTVQGSSTASLEFLSGSVFTAQTNFTGYAFGNATGLANTVIFRNGARYEQLGGSAPFGSSSAYAVVSFEPASMYYFGPSTSTPATLSGRTYGNFEYNLPTRTATSSTGNSPVTFAGDLIITAGTANISLPGGAILKGNLLMNGGTLNFTPSSNTTVQFAGSAAQRLGGTVAGSSPTFASTVTLQVNNAAGLTLGQPVSIPGTLQLTSGLLTTDTNNILTLAAGTIVTDASDASFVNGPVRRPVGTTTAATSYLFPVGKGSAYRPITLRVNTQTGTTNYRAEQFEGSPGGSLANPDANGTTTLARISRVRYFTLSPYNSDAVPVLTQPTGFAGTVQLTYGADDRVTDPTASTLVVAKRSDATQPWSNFGRTSYAGTASSGTLMSGTITSFSDFALASTDPATNPLPVRLTSFTVQRPASGAVALAWATASELHSAHFHVERSLDGYTFEPVATVTAQGSSAQARRYEAHDASAPAGRLYYRLKMVDQDGSFAYSAVATIGSALAELLPSPNPAGTQVGFYTEQALPYLVRSALGQVVRQGSSQAGGLTQLDLQGLVSGVYFLELHADGGRLVRRFVKE